MQKVRLNPIFNKLIQQFKKVEVMAEQIKETFNPNEHQHIRFNPLKGEWVLVSPHRGQRPWSGQLEKATDCFQKQSDPTNPLCPGVMRASGKHTEQYESTYVFENDFPALLESGPRAPPSDDELFQCQSATGTCRVMCYHPNSNIYIHTMKISEIKAIIAEWIHQTSELGAKYTWVQIFENRGEAMGCSNPHPHCQIWASNFLPNEPKLKDIHLRQYYAKHKVPLLCNYLQKELERNERIVIESRFWVVLVPYWAVWPFETMILPRQQIQRFPDVSSEQRGDLASVLQQLVVKYDNLFKCAFPYSMGWHGAPTGDLSGDQPHWTFHGIYYPPLLRSANVRKFIVGYELLAQAQRDLTPEKAAQMLKAQPDIHYTLTE